MPKIKSLEPLETKPFKVQLAKNLKYFKIDNTLNAKKRAYADDVVYGCSSASFLEVKKGKKTYHNITLYIDEETYENKSIEVGDIIQLSDKIKWKSRPLQYVITNADRLSEYPKSQIKMSAEGVASVILYENAYRIEAPLGTWSIVEKTGEYYRANVASRIQVTFDTKESMLAYKDNPYYIALSTEEYDNLAELHNTTVKFVCYAHQQSAGSWEGTLILGKSKNTGEYFMKIVA